MAAPGDSRLGGAREVRNWHGTLIAGCECTFLMNERRALSPSYAAAELLWYLSGSDNVAMLRAYAPSYEQRTGAVSGRAHGAYGPRIMPRLDVVLSELRERPDSRRAVLALWDPYEDNYAALRNVGDVPCTLSHQFMVREGALHLTCTMRSNDVWLGMPYDVFAFTCLQRLVANTLGVHVGEYHHQAASMHLYEKHAVAATEAVTKYPSALDGELNGWQNHDTLDRCADAVQLERNVRVTYDTHDTFHRNGVRPLPPMLKDLVVACARHQNTSWNHPFLSPALDRAWRTYADRRGDRSSRQDDAVQKAPRGAT